MSIPVVHGPGRERPHPVVVAQRFDRFGDRAALIVPGVAAPDEVVTYVDLERRVGAAADQLGPERGLVVLEADGSLDAVVTYLAALRAGHPVVLTAPGSRGAGAGAGGPLAAYRPDTWASRDAAGTWQLNHVAQPEPSATRATLHPDLALLLSTSGSTGSAKLVRLSGGNIMANARSIVSYLQLGHDDRAITTLPMHYCYGLSVIHTHLLVGGALVLSQLSVVDPCFWDVVSRHGVTGFAGVPHTFDLLDRAGFEHIDVPSLRYVTQAGGRLEPDRVRRYAELGRRRGWDLFVMYGQTEATARMAYLPPARALTDPDAIGVAVDGGSFSIDPAVLAPDERAAWGDGVGELVYRGPNVMMGYATGPDDLALGGTTPELRTGDLARRTPDGLYQIVGRRSRFVKLFGLRIDLQQVEAMVDEMLDATAAGASARSWCTGDDHRLVIATVGVPPPELAPGVASRLGIPASAVAVVGFDTDVPRLPSGKPDYVAIRRRATEVDTPGPEAPASVAGVFATVLGRRDVEPSETFVGLGGDSLSYVEASIQLERLVGRVPLGWQTMTVEQLDALERRTSVLRHVEGSVALRAAAITFIVGTHFAVFDVPGGAFILLCIAGFNFARFQLATVISRGSVRPILRTVLRILVPTLVAVVLFNPTVTVGSMLLIDSYRAAGNRVYGLWFVEVLIHVLLACAAMFAIPWFRRLRRASPFRFAAVVTAAALVMKFAAIPLWRADSADLKVTHNVAWMFALGWMVYEADTVRRRSICSVVTVVAFAGIAESVDIHLVTVVGVLALVWIPVVAVPPPFHWVIGALASASLYIYLTHFPVSEWVPNGHPALRMVVALVIGVLVWWAIERLPGAALSRARALRAP